MHVTVDLLVDAAADARGVALSLGALGGPATAVGTAKGSLLSYYDGPRQVNAKATMQAGVWYRIEIATRPAQSRFDLRVLLRDKRAAILKQENVALRESTPVDRVCFQTLASAGESSLYIDNLVVRP